MTGSQQVPSTSQPDLASDRNVNHLSDSTSESPLADPTTLTTPSSVRHALVALSSHSAALDQELARLLQDSEPILEQAQDEIASLGPKVDVVWEEADVLDARLRESAAVAKRISERVRILDEERRRVAAAVDWAVKVSDLKSSLISLSASIDQHDWDSATKHCMRAMSVDKTILTSRFASAVVPTAELPEAPEDTLFSMRKRMLQAFTKAFNEATEMKDEAEASRFFKLFPLIGWKGEGLEVYSTFAKGLVRERGRMITENIGRGKTQAPTHFATLLTGLFEHLAMLIDMHQPVVDRHYGKGNFAEGVMNGLQEECDRLGCRIIDAWRDDRAVRRRLDEVQHNKLVGAATIKSQVHSIKPILARPSTPAGGRTASSSMDEPSGPDGREIDRILTELAAIGSRWGLYRRFLKSRLLDEDDSGTKNETKEDTQQDAIKSFKDFRRISLDNAQPPSMLPEESLDEAETKEKVDITSQSALGKQVGEALSGIYMPMETWYLRSSIEKAFRIDQPDLTVKPYTSSILDDVFYVLRSVLARNVSTSSLPTVSEMFRVAKTTIEEEYIEVIVRKLEGVWRQVSGSMTVDGPRKEAATREMKTQFAVYLNVLGTSSLYMERIISELGSEQALSRMFEPSEMSEVLAIVNSLSVLVNRFKAGLRTELDQLFTQTTKPRLRNVLLETYKDASYILDDDSYAEAEYRDIVRRRFIKGWEHVLAGYRDIFTESNYNSYVSMALDALLKPWEKLVLGMKFTELGALRFDKDVRGISTYLASQTSMGVREKFTRLQQISYILNLDGTEDEGDLYESAVASGISWRLSPSEVKSVRALRL
ncbi:COG4-domain-containing protein [Violaceomyces palustris]|uniref:COG4-domain-containing protein n=1 Tax=Violaceomyces palustris TaxID=1673888 RepID=A0ACD0NWQ4_9BASI|nr:COG4-domain-containing protein [Violaceomyces palustris]